ncbi:NAD-P-binding protein [Artomyces pyxidatus]|uniref:NAD-P-binding protein n=1 Tax=Artomyces pyxidatus TaxID=48021 RepID=A0ACB8SR91_9AGAM|nr:NAD-P-binding protein [Artomyces pyxidatus]
MSTTVSGITFTKQTHLGVEMTKIPGIDEDIARLTRHKDVYPTIDPTPLFVDKEYEGRVVLVTGASRGIGAEIALHYARAGAAVSLLARSQGLLDDVKAKIENEVPGARVLTLTVDVKDAMKAAEAVQATVKKFGKLDVLVANAGASRPFGTRLGLVDPVAWWDTIEVNLRGPFNFIRFTIPHLEKSKGYIVVITSVAAQLRLATGSDYGVSKHAVDRLIEYIPLEHPDVKAFAMHPGNVDTQLVHENFEGDLPIAFDDKPALAASTALYLTAGKADWLTGRYISAQWDLGELEREYKEKVLEKNGLVSKLSLP